MKTGQSLIEEIAGRRVRPGGLAFWWLGQHSYALRTANKTIYLDPYLSPDPKRLLQAPLKPGEVSNADIITGSHDHADHIDHQALPAIMEASPKALLVVPRASIASLERDSLDKGRIVPLDDGRSYESDGVKITALKAAHEFFDHDEKAGYPYLGYVIETDGVSIYHAGDTCMYDGLAASLRRWRLSAAFLPINGRDAVRLRSGCIGNMTYQEAADLAGAIEPELTVPSHYGMFAFNNADPQFFIDYMGVKYPHLRCAVPKLGEATVNIPHGWAVEGAFSPQTRNTLRIGTKRKIMDTAALKIPQDKLIQERDNRLERKKARMAELDREYGKGRIPLSSYMENLGWPELFGYDMNRFLDDAGFAIEHTLRQVIFWADNVDDDMAPGNPWVMQADVGMYWDATLFGQRIVHTSTGVPEFRPHPFQSAFDLALLGNFDFEQTGDMPKLIAKYGRMKEISKERYGGRVEVRFPCFHRGPLDLYVQLRGYENFLEDLAERPEGLREALSLIVESRHRFAKARRDFLGEDKLPETSFVADDWVNIPFISPGIFREFVMPQYARIQNNEGPVTGFHTCGNLLQVVGAILEVFPHIRSLEVSPWNDIEKLDAGVAPEIQFNIQAKNTVVLSGSEKEQREVLESVARVSTHRRVDVCAQAIVRLLPTYEENLSRLNSFLAKARETLRQPPCH